MRHSAAPSRVRVHRVLARAAVLAAFLCAAGAASAAKESPVLPPSAAEGFQRMIGALHEGADPEVRVLDVAIERDKVRLTVRAGANAQPTLLWLRHPGARPASTLAPRYFALDVQSGAEPSTEARRALVAAIDAAFARDPFDAPRGPSTPGAGARTFEEERERFLSEIPHDRGMMPREAALATLLLLALFALAAAVRIVRVD